MLLGLILNHAVELTLVKISVPVCWTDVTSRRYPLLVGRRGTRWVDGQEQSIVLFYHI